MGKVICLNDVRKAAKARCSRVKKNKLFMGGRWLSQDEWRELCIKIGSRRFKDGIGC